MHTCVFFTLICLACFPSSATARTDWFSDGHFSAEIDLSQEGGGGGGGGTLKSVKISRFQIDANLTDSFALRGASSRRDSYTCPVVVVGRLASTWCQRPNDTSFGASGRKPSAARRARWLRWARLLRWARWLRIIAGLVRVCTHAFSFPSSAWPASHRLRRPGPTGSAMATFRPKSTFRKQGGYDEKCQNISISSRCKFDRFFRVTTCQQPRRLQHVSSRRSRPSSEHVVPAAKRHFFRRIWPQTARGSLYSLAPLGSLTPLGSSGSYVYAHMRFLYSHLSGLLPIVCDGQDRPVQRWPLFGRNQPFASRGGTLKSVKISRFQIDANLTDSYALRRASSRGDSNTCSVVVVGRLASTWCQRPNDTSLGASGRKPRAARCTRWLRWAR